MLYAQNYFVAPSAAFRRFSGNVGATVEGAHFFRLPSGVHRARGRPFLLGVSNCHPEGSGVDTKASQTSKVNATA